MFCIVKPYQNTMNPVYQNDMYVMWQINPADMSSSWHKRIIKCEERQATSTCWCLQWLMLRAVTHGNVYWNVTNKKWFHVTTFSQSNESKSEEMSRHWFKFIWFSQMILNRKKRVETFSFEKMEIWVLDFYLFKTVVSGIYLCILHC